MFNKPSFSIIVPTYNEEKDIYRTLNALEALDWDGYEVIIVDGHSTDKTIEIIKGYANRLSYFSLLFQPESKRKGVAEARNIGIKAAKNNVLVILNADVILPRDFLGRIAPYYLEGKYWVSVFDRVLNTEKLYPRYVGAEGYYVYTVKGAPWVWTEGFSCRKDAALEVGLFSEDMPGFSGEDVDFGVELEKRYPGVRATEIIVPHIAPDTLKEFWWQQRARGKGRTNYYYYAKHFSLFHIILNTILSTVSRLVKIVIPLPIIRAWHISLYSGRRHKDFIPFMWISYVKDAGMIIGMWQALFRVINVGWNK
ncbi:MAG: glycosyltransferase [Patescibacteria group bacterium]